MQVGLIIKLQNTPVGVRSYEERDYIVIWEILFLLLG